NPPTGQANRYRGRGQPARLGAAEGDCSHSGKRIMSVGAVMRASELLGCELYDVDGVLIGHVHDLRFEARPASGRAVSYRLTALQCGSASAGHRLGYGHGDMAGPWPLKWAFQRAAHRSLIVEWSDVAKIRRPRIDVCKRKADLSTVGEDAR